MSIPNITPTKVGNNDPYLDATEWKDVTKDLKPTDDVMYFGQKYKWGELKNMKGKIVDSGTPKAVSGDGKAAIDAQVKVVTRAHEILTKIDQELANIKTQLAEAGKIADKVKREATIKDLKKSEASQTKRKSKIASDQQGNLAKLSRMHGAKKVSGKASWWTKAGATVPKHLQGKNGKGGVSAAMTSGKAAAANAPKQQQQAGGNKAAAKSNSGKAGTSGGYGPTSGWGGKAMSGPSFSSGAYAQSLFMEDNIMGSWDKINKSQNRGQELMQLLFYYMRMAMSGDLTAMYNMMKAVLYIISKDKALQQVHMANKLIELQDASRKATDKLLNFNADQNDPNSQMQFTKMLQMVKSDSDSIATSQKLIAQMMEEMAQIVETLTNVTKGALDASGRVLRTVSRFT